MLANPRFKHPLTQQVTPSAFLYLFPRCPFDFCLWCQLSLCAPMAQCQLGLQKSASSALPLRDQRGCTHMQTISPWEAGKTSGTQWLHSTKTQLEPCPPHSLALSQTLYLRLCLLSLAETLRTNTHPAHQAIKLTKGGTAWLLNRARYCCGIFALSCTRDILVFQFSIQNRILLQENRK